METTSLIIGTNSFIESIRMTNANNTYLFLIDESNWQDGTSMIGLYDMPKLHSEQGFERSSKGTLILPPSGTNEKEESIFLETVCRNFVSQIKVFTDRKRLKKIRLKLW